MRGVQRSAARRSCLFSADTSAKLLIVHVVEDTAKYEDHGFGGFPVLEDEMWLEDELEHVLPNDPRVAYEHRLLHGDPTRMIVRLAESEHADFIVMGTYGRTGMMRLLMGSGAEHVIRHAQCPVLTVKQPRHSIVETASRSQSSHFRYFDWVEVANSSATESFEFFGVIGLFGQHVFKADHHAFVA